MYIITIIYIINRGGVGAFFETAYIYLFLVFGSLMLERRYLLEEIGF